MQSTYAHTSFRGPTTLARPLLALLPLIALLLAANASASGFVLGPPREASSVQHKGKKPKGLTDTQVERAWKRSSREERSEVLDFLMAECERMKTFRASLMRFLLQEPERPLAEWPVWAKQLSLYDSTVHAPEQPIKRRFKSSSSTKRFREKVFRKIPERKLDTAWRYNYGTGQIEQSKDVDDQSRIFRNALAGFEPNYDLCEAMVERILDDGELRTTHQAFAFAYANREGYAYPGVSLYDMWSSGLEMEMPDVECLGIVHLVDADWKTWKAPVSKQSSLYKRIGEHFSNVRRHRGLRNALARVFLGAEPALNDGYEGNLDRFHGLWEKFQSDPGEMADALPNSEDWLDWLEKVGKEVDTSRELYTGSLRRKSTLQQDSATVRATLIWVMRELELLPAAE
ncbi:MAG: hypothetical protein ACI841_002228 [Planctomycetota bacterium]|jgi:hypothetical protein